MFKIALAATALAAALAACSTDRVVLGEREGVFDAMPPETPPVDAEPVVDAEPGPPDAEPLCTCCCEVGEGTCPELCACIDGEDCPGGFACEPVDGQDGLFCVVIPL